MRCAGRAGHDGGHDANGRAFREIAGGGQPHGKEIALAHEHDVAARCGAAKSRRRRNDPLDARPSEMATTAASSADDTLTMREMGLTEPPNASNPESGVVNAFQRIVSGTGEFAGATGYLFVSGFNHNQRVVTTVRREICTAAAQ